MFFRIKRKKNGKMFGGGKTSSYFCTVNRVVIITMLKKMEANLTFDYLNNHGVKPSVQRMAVMGYLLENHTHPTADDVYQALLPDLPTLSKTTVYNTLKLLVEQGAALQLTIDERNVCYDAITKPHAHFLCRRCNKVYDLHLEQKELIALAAIPRDFEVDSSQLYFRGCCKKCCGKRKKQQLDTINQ